MNKILLLFIKVKLYSGANVPSPPKFQTLINYES